MAVLPLSLVLVTVGPLELAEAVLVVVAVFADILAVVGPREDTVAVEAGLVPLAAV